MRRSAAVAMLGCLLLASARCQSEQTVAPGLGLNIQSNAGQGGDGGSGGLVIVVSDAAPEADGLCGDQAIPALTQAPNVYFVVDRSGSMEDSMPDSIKTKLHTARDAISHMLIPIGHRIRYGAAVFPIPNLDDSCAPGHEIYSVTRGDPSYYAVHQQIGSVLQGLLDRLDIQEPGSGATPTAASLLALIPKLQALPGKTYVVLMTDGAPNCNFDLSCGADGCQPNIEHAAGCTPTVNCCDPAAVGSGPLGMCVDRDDTIAAVTQLAALGIQTYVVGMPGTTSYADLLNALATAGQTARPGNLAYYEASDTPALDQALQAIGSQVSISCDIQLEQPPADQTLFNVLFDGHLVPQDPDGSDDGWSWTGPQSLRIRGSSCTELLSGNVVEVLVLAGCPTILR